MAVPDSSGAGDVSLLTWPSLPPWVLGQSTPFAIYPDLFQIGGFKIAWFGAINEGT